MHGVVWRVRNGEAEKAVFDVRMRRAAVERIDRMLCGYRQCVDL
jgi:hypothetical protein